jgi:hypothetical protein
MSPVYCCAGFIRLKAVLRIRDVYPGSEFFHPGSEFFHPGSPSKNLILTQKIVSSVRSRKYDPDFLPIPDPGVKKASDPDPQHCFKGGSNSYRHS